MHKLLIQKFRNVNNIHPKCRFWSCYFYIEHHKFVIRSVLYSFLNCLWSFHIIGMFLRPTTTKKLSINLNYFCFWIILFNFLKNIVKMIVEFIYGLFSIVKCFSEILTRIFTRNRNFLGEKISSSSVSCNFIFSKVMD